MEPVFKQMGDYLKIEEVADSWKISPRRVQALCAAGKISGAVRFGRDWMIPKSAQRPVDGRTKAGRNSDSDKTYMPMPKNTPFLYMTDLYRVPGDGEKTVEKLAANHEAQVLFAAEVAYSRGDIDKVYESASYLLHRRSGFYSVLAAGTLLALCAIWRGDLSMWRRAKMHIAEAPAKGDNDRDIMTLSITAVDSMLYDVVSFPDWFKIGCFEPLHFDAFPAAKVFYAKYLYAAAYAVATKEINVEGMKGLSLMSILPNTIEPLICQTMAEGSMIAEIYLRLTCATVYRTCGNEDQAIRHIDRALTLALPDRLFGLVAEYYRALGSLLEQRLNLYSSEALLEVKRLYKVYNEGWSLLSGSVRGRKLITTLSQKEREVAKLAAFGLQNSEIAEKLHMSLSGVKQAVRIVSEKSGVSRDEFAAIL